MAENRSFFKLQDGSVKLNLKWENVTNVTGERLDGGRNRLVSFDLSDAHGQPLPVGLTWDGITVESVVRAIAQPVSFLSVFALIGSVIAPGLGTAVGAVLGGGIGTLVTYLTSRADGYYIK